MSFDDLRTIKVAIFLRWIAGGTRCTPTLTNALPFEAVIHAIDAAAASGQRVTL